MKTILFTSIRTLLVAAAVAVQPLAATAASAAELLEKGIYTEETKGDLEAAIAIYQQLMAEAKVNQSLAAQAQFRIAQCYRKKNRAAEATAAFEKLIRDFPGEKELVAKARTHLPAELALLPIPWVDGERLHVTFALGNVPDIGAAEYRAVRTESAGRQVWQVGARTHAGGNSLSRVEVDAETFQPISSTWKHALLGEASASYRPGEVEITRPGKEPTKIAFDNPVYDNEQAVHLMRRLPLAEGYKTTVAVISSLGGATPFPLEIEVVAKEEVQVPAGKFECFKVKLNVGQTFWFSTDAHRYPVKFEAGGATGTLDSIAQRKAADPVPFHNDALGISLTAPAEWVIHLQANDKATQFLHLLDPAADAEAVQLRLAPTEKLSAAAHNSARTWADTYFLKDLVEELKNPRIREDGWKNYSVSGRPGVSFIADYTDKEKPMVMLALFALGPKNSELFMLSCPTDKLDALRPAFESIVASYRTTK